MNSFAAGNNHKQPRVAVVSRLDQPGGVQSVALSLIKGLNARGVVPDLLWDTPPNPALLNEFNARAGFYRLPFPIATRLLDRAPTTARYLLRLANVIHSQRLARQYDFYFIFYNGFLVPDGTPHLRYLSGPPLLPQLDLVSPGLRGLPYRLIRGLYHAGLRRRFPVYEYHTGSRYVINSQYTADLFAEAHGVRLPVVNPPINLSGRSFTADDIYRRDTITYFSRFIDYKRPEMVVRLAKQYPQHRFMLMGGVKPQQQAYYEQLREQARALGLQNVEFQANPPGSQVRAELARARFFVFPGVNEHFGMATAEAIGSGAIPYVHDSGGQREVVPDPRLRFADPLFFEQFDHLVQLSPQALNQIRARLRRHVEQFSDEAFIQKMLAYTNLPLESEMENEFQTQAI